MTAEDEELPLSTVSLIAQGTYAGTGTTGLPPRPRYSIFDMDAPAIQEVTAIEDLQDLVTQIESMPTLEARDVGPVILPLTRRTSMKMYGYQGAVLTERLILACLARLPAESSDRYTAKTTHACDPNDGDSSMMMMTTIATTESHQYSTTNGTSVRTSLPYPTAAMYNRGMIAWGNLLNGASAARAEGIFQLQLQEYVRELKYLQDQQQQQRTDAALPVVTVETDDDSSSDDDVTSGRLPQQQLLLPLEPFTPPPDRRCYKSLIRAWAVSKESNGAARAYEILRTMECLSGVPALLNLPHDPNMPPPPPVPQIDIPDLGTYNVVMSAYAKVQVLKHPKALERVLDIVKRVQDLHDATVNDNFVLDGYSYVSILQAYSRYIAFCPTPLEKKYSQEILAILTRIHELIELKKQQPQEEDNYQQKKMDGNKKEVEADRHFLYPLSMSWAYGVAVDALVKTEPSHESLALADDIVIAMTGRRNRINTPNMADPAPLFIPYKICAQVWPHHETLMLVVQGWYRSGLPRANERLERLLHIVVVEAEYARTFFLHEAMEKWCLSGWQSAPYLVESILQRALEKASAVKNKPTGQSFSIAMKAWMRSKLNEAPYRAELLLQHMLHLYENQGDSWFCPKEIHLRYVATCWLNRCKDGKRYDGISGKNMYPAEHCESILMWLRGKPWFGDLAMGQYAMAIRTWAHQQILTEHEDEPNFVQRAANLLDLYAETLPEGALLPPFPCNWVLQACCRRQPNLQRRLEAYYVAITTFNRCKQNARTFTLTVQVLRAQVEVLDDEHLSVIEDLFKKCCSCGMLTQEMISAVVDVVSAEALQRLFGLSFQMAQLMVDSRGSTASFENNTFGKGRIPSVLLVSNLPHEWSIHADTQRKLKEAEM